MGDWWCGNSRHFIILCRQTSRSYCSRTCSSYGGVSLLLYGVIGASGIRVLLDSKVDYNKPQNLILTAIILIVGVSGASIQIGAAELKGMALATIVGIVLSLVFKLVSIVRPETELVDNTIESVSGTANKK